MHEESHGQDFIVSELLAELKAGNERKDIRLREKDKLIWRIIFTASLMMLATVAGFLFYLYQYDFTSYDSVSTTNNADGVYAIIDSEGNVISSDLTMDEINNLLEGMTGGEGITDAYSSDNANEEA